MTAYESDIFHKQNHVWQDLMHSLNKKSVHIKQVLEIEVVGDILNM